MATITRTARQIKTDVAPVPCPDIRVSNHGSIFLFSPTSAEAFKTLQELVPPGRDSHYFGRALVVEHRYVDAVIDQLLDDEMTVA